MKRHSLFLLICLLAAVAFPIEAQEGEPEPPSETIYITQIDASRMPLIQVQAYGRNATGESLDFSSQPVVIQHGGQTIGSVEVAGRQPEGTLTIFLVDTPAGIEGQLEAIKTAMLSFAAEPYMREQVDYIAVYQVTGRSAQILLEPTQFYNTVLNFFVDPLPIQNGPTALFDSLGNLINEVDALRPVAGMPVSIVVLSDGTDVVSTQFDEGRLISAAEVQDIPLHTILVGNENLPANEIGGRFLSNLATGTGGLSGTLTDNPVQDLGDTLWARIASFRDQTILHYTLPEPQPGASIPVSLMLADNQEVKAETAVTIAETAGLLTLPIPADSRTLTVPDVTDGVRLSFPAEVRWLDGQERELMAAQLWVNGSPVVDLDPGSIAATEVLVPNLAVGSNEVWLNGVDEIGQQLSGPVVNLTVVQGDRLEIPELLTPTSSWRWVWILGCFSFLALVGVLVWWRRPLQAGSSGRFWENIRLPALDFSTRPRRRPTAPVSDPGPVDGLSIHDSQQLTPAGHALDVLDASTLLVSPIGLNRAHIRLGRSPNQADIVFDQDMTMSRVHASMSKEGQSYRLFDEGSTSGSFVNDQSVPQYGTLLMDGDEIQLGAVRLRYRVVWDITP